MKTQANLTSFFIFIFLLITNLSVAQSGTWTLMSGSLSMGVTGTPGTKGVPASTNTPHALYSAAGWTDLNGNFWIFGGVRLQSYEHSSLWKYDVDSGMWTWMHGNTSWGAYSFYGTQGVPSPTNQPSSRFYGSATWTDLNGDLWLFGGYGYDKFGLRGQMNDLWKYNIATNEWTWINGSNIRDPLGYFGTLQIPSDSNQPPPRSETSANWVDSSGNFWMYGGSDGYDDMWKYNVSTNQWTWMSGQQTFLISPNHGIKGIPSSTNTPGSRRVYAKWKDSQDNFWMYGGFITDQNSNTYSNDVIGDMWMYNHSTNLWTWMAGDPQDSTKPSTFTQKCIIDTGLPPRTWENRACWTDACGRFWLYGGMDGDYFNNYPLYTLLWMFDPNTLKFVWMGGTTYEYYGYPTPYPLPPGPYTWPIYLCGSNAFTSSTGDFWMFGGSSGGGYVEPYNTLWRYNMDSLCAGMKSSASYYALNDTVGCAPYTVQFKTFYNSDHYHWDFGDSTTTADTSNIQSPSWTYTQSGTYHIQLIVSNNNSCNISTDTVTNLITVNICTGIEELYLNSFEIYPNPATDQLTIQLQGMKPMLMELFDVSGRIVLQKSIQQTTTLDLASLQSGLYLIRIGNSVQRVVIE